MNRRDFIKSAASAGLASAAFPAASAGKGSGRGMPMLAADYTIVARDPNTRDLGAGEPETYFMAMSLVKLPNGKLIAAIPRGRRNPKAGLEALLIAVSADRGATWRTVCELPYDSSEPVMYVHKGRPYLFMTPNRPESDRRTNYPREGDGRIWASASDDEGVTWTKPVAVIRGKPKYTSGGQTALWERNGRLYWTVSERYQTLAAVCCNLEGNILDPASWRISELTRMPIPRELVIGPISNLPTMTCLEGNVVEVGGRLMVLSRTVIDHYRTSNMGGVFEIHDDRESGRLELRFVQLYPIPGGQCKFYIQYDPPSQLYWMATNLPSNSQDLIQFGKTLDAAAREKEKNWTILEDRRLLTLWYSVDALNWIPAGWIAKADSWSRSFCYPTMLIDGPDLIMIVRTARDSGNYHDADLATFHRVRDFRSLALDVRPRI